MRKQEKILCIRYNTHFNSNHIELPFLSVQSNIGNFNLKYIDIKQL